MIGKDLYPIIPFEGIKLKTNGNDVIITAGLMNGNFEPFTIHIFHALVREALATMEEESCFFVDVGANIGVFAVTAAAIDSRLKVFAFEPNPISYQLLADNIELNKLTNVTPMNTAIGEGSGMASLDISSHSAGLYSIHGTGSKRMEVPLVSLDDFFATRGIWPRLFKADVEGYEPLVLRGMQGLLARSPLQIILEFNPELLKQGGKEPEQFLKELALQFDAIYCLGEIERKTILYRSGDLSLERKICSIGCNLVLIKGEVPECLACI